MSRPTTASRQRRRDWQVSDTGRVLRHLWWVVGLALVCCGVAVALTAQAGPDEFGWFAYAPPSGDPEWQMSWIDPVGSGSVLIVSRWQVAGSAVVAAGLMVIAGDAGFRLGQRRAERREQL